MPRTQNNTLNQNCYVVRDLEESMHYWMDALGIGPFFHLPHIGLSNIIHRGAPAALDISAAVAFSGNIQIELIVQHNDGPSPYRDVVAAGEEGFHHICLYPDDYAGFISKYEAMGCPVAGGATITSTGTEFVYMDARERLNCMVELVDLPSDGGQIWAPMIEATDAWDGVTDPIRVMQL